MNKKNIWTEKVLNSLEGIKKAEPSDALFDRLLTQLPQTDWMTKSQLLWAAVAASMLIALNLYAFSFDKQEINTLSSTEYVKLIEDYSLYQ